jgi:hypothetical protein
MKGGLLGIGLVIMGLAPRIVFSFRRIRATGAEQRRSLPGDNLIPKPIGSLTHAMTILCSRKDLWPWLVQMGAGRGGWYSYDFLDNGGNRSAAGILPEFQKISAGTLFPALPGARDGFFVLDFTPQRFLVLGAIPQNGKHAVTWAFVLDDADANATRLIVRARAAAGYQFHRCPLWVVRVIHYVMQRKQLLEIGRRAEMTILVTEHARIAS